MVFPLGSHLADVPKLADADVNICMYREFGRCFARRSSGPTCRRRSACTARRLPAQARRAAEPRSRALHRAREAHHDQADVGSVALGDAGLLRHRQLRHRRQRDLRPRRAPFPRRRLGLPCNFAISRIAGEKTDNDAVRQLVKDKTPLVLFGSYNERMYLAEAGGAGMMKAHLHSGLVPRRDHPPAHGHALHGLCRCDLPRGAGSLQRAVRRAVPHPAAGYRHGPRRMAEERTPEKDWQF
jgi:3,8-divinyl chlorophyllide a/chlorophyllide a reductase subunit Z